MSFFPASKEKRHYNMYGEKKDPDLRLYADRDQFNQSSVLNFHHILQNTKIFTKRHFGFQIVKRHYFIDK